MSQFSKVKGIKDHSLKVFSKCICLCHCHCLCFCICLCHCIFLPGHVSLSLFKGLKSHKSLWPLLGNSQTSNMACHICSKIKSGSLDFESVSENATYLSCPQTLVWTFGNRLSENTVLTNTNTTVCLHFLRSYFKTQWRNTEQMQPVWLSSSFLSRSVLCKYLYCNFQSYHDWWTYILIES